MRQHRSSGSVEGVMGNHDSYSDWTFSTVRHAILYEPVPCGVYQVK